MSSSHSTTELVLVSTAALALGAAAGIAITSQGSSQLRRAKRKIMTLLGLSKESLANGKTLRSPPFHPHSTIPAPQPPFPCPQF